KSLRGAGDMGAIAGRRWAWTFAFAALYLGLAAHCGSSAWAQGHRSEPAPASPPSSTLTGDWGGLRSYLDSNGVTITLNYTNDFLANVRGGIGPGAVGIGVFQPQLDLDLNKLVGWEGGKFHTHGLITHGPLFSPAHLNNILAVSNLETGPVARLYSFWYAQNAFNDRLSVRAGLMSADSQFLQSQTAANFINNAISWPTFLAANLPAGGPAYPLPAPGIRVRIKPRDDLAFQAAVFSGDPSGGNGSNQPAPLPTGTVVSFRGGAFFIAEASYLPNQGKDATGLPGAYRIGAWFHNSSRFGDQRFDNTGLSLADPQSTGIPLNHTGDSGSTASSIRCSIASPAATTKACRDSSARAAFRTIAISSISMPTAASYTKPRTLAPERQGRGCRRLCPRRGQCARARCRHRILRKLFLPGAQRGSHGGDDLPGPVGAVVDAAAGGAIHHPSGRWRSQQRWKLAAECVGDCSSFGA